MNKYLDYIMRFFKFFDNITKDDAKTSASKPRDKSRHVTAKILALLMAVGLWLYVMNEQNPPLEVRYTIPLEIRNVPANYVVAEHPDGVRVKLRGPRILMSGISGNDVKAYVDMTGFSEGRHNTSVRSIVPAHVELVETIPEMAVVRLEPIITRTLPVVVDFSGVLPKSVSISRVNAKLTEATVKGPKHIVDTVDKLVGTLDVTGKTNSFFAEAPLAPVGRGGILTEGLTVSPQVTAVQVDIAPNAIKKTMEVKPIFTGQLPSGLSLKGIVFDPAHIEVQDPSGVGTIIEKLEYVYTEPISLSELTRDTNKVVKLSLPEGLTAVTNSTVAHIRVSK